MPVAGASLDVHLMAVRDQLAHAGRHQADAVLVDLHLLGHTDAHARPS